MRLRVNALISGNRLFKDPIKHVLLQFDYTVTLHVPYNRDLRPAVGILHLSDMSVK
jgi:hypothetical protein